MKLINEFKPETLASLAEKGLLDKITLEEAEQSVFSIQTLNEAKEVCSARLAELNQTAGSVKKAVNFFYSTFNASKEPTILGRVGAAAKDLRHLLKTKKGLTEVLQNSESELTELGQKLEGFNIASGYCVRPTSNLVKILEPVEIFDKKISESDLYSAHRTIVHYSDSALNLLKDTCTPAEFNKIFGARYKSLINSWFGENEEKCLDSRFKNVCNLVGHAKSRGIVIDPEHYADKLKLTYQQIDSINKPKADSDKFLAARVLINQMNLIRAAADIGLDMQEESATIVKRGAEGSFIIGEKNFDTVYKALIERIRIHESCQLEPVYRSSRSGPPTFPVQPSRMHFHWPNGQRH